MRIVLATSPHVRHPAVLQSDFSPDPSSMYGFAPVGLLSLAAALREELSIEATLFDTNQAIVTGAIPLDASFYVNAAARICTHEPDVFGFMTECDSYHHVLQILEEVQRQRPQCRCILGGPHASAVARPTMEKYAFVDAIVIGEGERTLSALVRAYAAGDAGPVAGALRRDAAGHLVDGGPRPLAVLDELPMPAYDLYRGTPPEEIFVEVGRGCPFQCTFCSTAPYWQRRHRVKSPARIVEEIAVVKRLYGSQRVHFTHDLLTTDKRWVRDLCDTLIEAGVPVKWTCSARADTVDRPLLAHMAAAGCNAIYFGIESGSARVLSAIQKSVPIEESLDVLRQCREVGIRPNAGFIVGFPFEDRDSLRDTFDAFEQALAIGTRPTHIFGFCPFASSSLYKDLVDMTCDGHFLDIPIEPALDAANRARIAADPTLYGSYFRPRVDVGATRLQGIDEFSCLIDTVVLPFLALSRILGGSLEVFDRWSAWIERRNIAVGASPHRRFYGGPLAFSTFIVEELRAAVPADHPMLQLAEVVHTSFDVAGRWAAAAPTTMATFRSFALPDVGRPIALGDEVRLNAMVATMRLDYDVVPLLSATPDEAREPERKPVYLMWELLDDRRVQLSQVDPFLYTAIEQLQQGPQPVAALMLEWAKRGDGVDYGHVFQVLTEARSLRIVETV